MSLRIRFGAPRANWLPLGVASASIAFDEVLAATPSDPVQGIAEAALAAASDQVGECVLFTEPETYALSFVPVPSGVRLEMKVWPDRRRVAHAGVRVFQSTGTSDTVLVPVWRGLRELGGRWPATPGSWRAPFPSDTVEKLGRALGAA